MRRIRRAQDTLPPVKESEFQSNVRELAQRLHWLAYHTYDSRRSDEGFPDLVLVRPPRVVVMELKSVRGQLSAAQAVWKVMLEQCPGVEYYGPLRPEDWDKIVEILQEV